MWPVVVEWKWGAVQECREECKGVQGSAPLSGEYCTTQAWEQVEYGPFMAGIYGWHLWIPHVIVYHCGLMVIIVVDSYRLLI